MRNTHWPWDEDLMPFLCTVGIDIQVACLSLILYYDVMDRVNHKDPQYAPLFVIIIVLQWNIVSCQLVSVRP